LTLRGAILLSLAAAACTSMAVGPRSLDGTNWHVAAVNGKATPESDRYRMSFEGDRISARFGCNSGGASYSVAGDVISAGPVMSTKMACLPVTEQPGPGPMEFENMGFSVLAQPMRMRWQSGTRLTLSNAAGSIVLDLAVTAQLR
jgi:heat shock protein HslJ